MGAGDVIAQLAVEKKSYKDYNMERTAKFSAIGFCFVGPALRRWYIKLDTLVVKEQPAFHRGIKKMVIDQTCVAPPFTLILSYLVPFVNGKKHEEIVQSIRDGYVDLMKRSYTLWPLAQVVNFSLLPIQYQVLFVQLIALIWNCYLSMVLNKEK
ncbi:hypothetical protein ACLKA6_017036 [Drosophila palustris]